MKVQLRTYSICVSKTYFIYLTHPVFNTHHSETDDALHKILENKDLSLEHFNDITWNLHNEVECSIRNDPCELGCTGARYIRLHLLNKRRLSANHKRTGKYLCKITAFAACSLQPNSGAQGEYAGLLTIKAYHENSEDVHRNVILIPISAHGTNPASAVMAGMKVVVVKCDGEWIY